MNRKNGMKPYRETRHIRNWMTVLLLWGVLGSAGLFAGEGLPVFPGASGFGSLTRAGRGGQILKVTTLENEGPGSLRAAVETKGPRTIVFEIGGVIDLKGQILSITEPFLTIAGQTAPAPHITLIGEGIKIETHDVLIQHLRIRAGDQNGGEPDGLSVGSSAGREVYNVVIDHCTFTWAIDENAAVSGKNPFPHDVTFSNCIIAHGLSHSIHSKGEHSKGTLIHDNVKRVALIGNLHAHNFRRNPYVKSGTRTVIANNVIYNPGELGIHFSRFGGEDVQAVVVGNVFRAGPDTQEGLSLVSTLGGGISLFLDDNLAFDAAGKPMALNTQGGADQVKKWNARYRKLKEAPFSCPGYVPFPAKDTWEKVLAGAGAFPARRDPFDARLVEEIRAGKGKIIDSPKEVGGPPVFTAVRRMLVLPAQPNDDPNRDGYTNLEEWLHKGAAHAEGK